MSVTGKVILVFESDRAVNYALEMISLGIGIELRIGNLSDNSIPDGELIGVLLDDQHLVTANDDTLIGTLKDRFACPVIVMTQSQSPRMTSYLHQMGASAVLTKPFRMGELRRQLWQVLHLEGQPAEKVSGESITAVTNAPVSGNGGHDRDSFSPAQYGGQVAGEQVFDQLFAELERRQPLQEGLDAFDVVERHLVQRALEACSGNQSQAARFLGITRNTLRKRIRKYGFTRLIVGEESSDSDET